MDREKFFSRKPQTDRVQVDNFGEVIIRKLTQAEVETCRRSYSTDATALAGYRYIVAKTVVNKDGSQVFTDDDQTKLAEIDFDIVNEIALAALKFSGVTKGNDPKARSVG